MRFGLELEAGEGLAGLIESAVLAEDLGYSSVGVSEHHGPEVAVPHPLVALAAVAARTERIQVMSHLVLLPLHHPVLVAEQAAMVQAISKGRLIAGVGLGYVRDDFLSYGVDFSQRAARMEEALPLLRRLWEEDEVEHYGRFYGLSGTRVRQYLEGFGRPALWGGGWAEKAIRRLARVADAWVAGPMADFATVGRCAATFHSAAAERGFEPQELSVSREVFCAPTRREAEEVGGARLFDRYRSTYLRWGHPCLGEAEQRMSYAELADDRFIIGTPDDCVKSIRRLEAIGVTRISFRLSSPGIAAEAAHSSASLFAREVMPVFAE